MVTRMADGSAGDANYATIGEAYTQYRRPDPRIAAHIAEALGAARTVLNVGAGAGSYEPADREVTPVEPSASMRAQRPAHLAPAVDATAESLPFADDAFDAAMTTFSVHQWGDLRAGLREMRRVTRGPVVILTCDPDLVRTFWLYEYAPEVLDTEARRYPSTAGTRRGPRRRRHRRQGPGAARLHGRVQRGVLRPAGGAPRPGRAAVLLGLELPRSPRCMTASPGNSPVIWPTAAGTGGTATCARSPPSTAPSSWSRPGPDCPDSPIAGMPDLSGGLMTGRRARSRVRK